MAKNKEEIETMLYPPTITESMLKQTTYSLKNGQIIDISLANRLDLEDIITIQEACYNGVAPWGRVAVNSELRNKRSSFFLMCHHQEVAIAFIGISMRQDNFHVTNIATRPEYQNQGIGSFLIDVIVDLAERTERKRVTLEVRMSNENAKSLYRTLGFKEVRIKRNYYHNNGEDALDMVYLMNEMGPKNNENN